MILTTNICRVWPAGGVHCRTDLVYNDLRWQQFLIWLWLKLIAWNVFFGTHQDFENYAQVCLTSILGFSNKDNSPVIETRLNSTRHLRCLLPTGRRYFYLDNCSNLGRREETGWIKLKTYRVILQYISESPQPQGKGDFSLFWILASSTIPSSSWHICAQSTLKKFFTMHENTLSIIFRMIKIILSAISLECSILHVDLKLSQYQVAEVKLGRR